MGIATFGLTAPYMPKLGMVNLSATEIGDLSAVIETEGGSAEDWTFETGIIGIVLRTADPTQMIHVAYSEDELDNDSFDGETTISGRTAAQGEIGFIGVGTPLKFSGEKYNIYFRATEGEGADLGDAVASRIFIELYVNIA